MPEPIRTRRSHLPTITLALVATLACGDEPSGPQYGGGDLQLELESGGLNRRYIVHVPASAAPETAAPMLLAYHGVGQTAGQLRDFTELNAYAEQAGMIVVYPEAHKRLESSWAVTETLARFEDVDDVEFTVDLIDNIASHLNIDPARVYATGLSNGALFTHRLGCELADRIRAIASVAATMIGEVATSCRPTRGISALLFHGTEDAFFPWGGSPVEDLISAEDTFDRWAFVNGCSGDAEIVALPDAAADGTTVERRSFTDCEDGSDVIFYVVTGGGHTWPGSQQQFSESVAGRTSQEFVASQLIVEFLSSQ
jgi:polyhydroxybutyrate depolymerase